MEGFVTQIADAAADDSDKTFTVPAGQNYEVLGIFVTLATSADVGNRNMQVTFGDGTNVIYAVPAGAVQAASVTRYYSFSPEMPDLTSMRATSYLMTPIPRFILPAAYTIRVYDVAAIAATADDMTVRILVRVYPKLPT
jgi:hypothetical protein